MMLHNDQMSTSHHFHHTYPLSRVTVHGHQRIVSPHRPSRFPAFVAGMILGALIGSCGMVGIMTDHNNTHDQPAPDMVPAADVPPLPEPDRDDLGILI